MPLAPEDQEVEQIRVFFESKNRAFHIGKASGSWEASFPIKSYPSAAPFATGHTPVEAARNALALWHQRPDLGGRLPQR